MVARIEGACFSGRNAAPGKGAACGDFTAELQKALRRGQDALDPLFAAAGKAFGVDPALLKAVARAESGLNPRAVSPKGAAGVMQLMPQTARSLGVSDPFDPVQSIFGGARYLRSLLDRFGGDIRLALAAYNAGPGAVERWGGIPPYRETKEYVDRVLGYLGQERDKEAFGSGASLETTWRRSSGDAMDMEQLLRMWGNALMLAALLEVSSSPDGER